ncbi:MAG: hypothetical protein IJN68_05370 [Clostridia bacterium]|nr:hypothetical protein [Clostridia bacterium]
MSLLKKSVSVFLALIFIFSSVTFAFAENDEKQDETENAISFGAHYDGDNKTFSTKTITVRFSNSTKSPVYDLTVQAVFDELIPVKKKESTVLYTAEQLDPGEEISVSYKVILNPNKQDVGFFGKIAFFFVKLFKGAYSVETAEVDKENMTVQELDSELTFGDFTAKSLITASYSRISPENKKDDKDNGETNTTKPDTSSTTAQTVEHTTTQPAVTLPPPIEHTTTTTAPTAVHTTQRYTTERYTTEKYSTTSVTSPGYRPTTTSGSETLEARAYNKYISFIRSNNGAFNKCDAADINDDGLLDLIIADYNGNASVLTYNDQYGIYELFSQPKGKGYNLPVYYSTASQIVIFPSASTGGSSYTTVYFDHYETSVTDTLVSNNGKTENEGCFNNGVKISEEEFNSIISGFPNRYLVVDGNPTQLIGVLQEYI